MTATAIMRITMGIVMGIVMGMTIITVTLPMIMGTSRRRSVFPPCVPNGQIRHASP